MNAVTTLRLGGKAMSAEVREALTGATLSRTISGASTLDLEIHDRDRQLVRAALFNERTAATLDGAVFELVAVRKMGSGLRVTMEDAVVADLRKDRGLLSAKPGTTTVDGFARRLVAGAPGAKFVAEPGQRNLVPLVRAADGEDQENSWETLQRLAEERGRRCFADRGTVYFGSDPWLLKRLPALTVREHTNGVEDIDWDCDAGKKASRAILTASMDRWSAMPGTPVNVLDQGLGSGMWLVETVTGSLFRKQGEVTLTREQPVLPEPKPDPRDDGQPASGASAAAGGSILAGPVSASGYSWPLSGPLTSSYGPRGGRLHGGVDIGVPIGVPVGAAKAGTVTFAGYSRSYGEVVYIDHGGAETRYAHMSKLHVRRGQSVTRGERLGLSGNTGASTGPHLHFEVRIGGAAVDPLKYLPSRR